MDYHVCFGSDGNLRVSEIWDSKGQWEAFGERLMPLLHDVGIKPGEPEILAIHNTIKRKPNESPGSGSGSGGGYREAE